MSRGIDDMNIEAIENPKEVTIMITYHKILLINYDDVTELYPLTRSGKKKKRNCRSD